MTVHSKICPPYNNRILDQTSQNWFTFEDETADNAEGRTWRFLVTLGFSAKLLTPFWRQLTTSTCFGFTLTTLIDGWKENGPLWRKFLLFFVCFLSPFSFSSVSSSSVFKGRCDRSLHLKVPPCHDWFYKTHPGRAESAAREKEREERVRINQIER